MHGGDFMQKENSAALCPPVKQHTGQVYVSERKPLSVCAYVPYSSGAVLGKPSVGTRPQPTDYRAAATTKWPNGQSLANGNQTSTEASILAPLLCPLVVMAVVVVVVVDVICMPSCYLLASVRC